TCRLVFDIQTDGTGLASSVVVGVQALLKSVKLNVRALAAPLAPDPPGGTGDSVDTFIKRIEVNASGGDDPAAPGSPCIALNAVAQLKDVWSGPKGVVKTPDTVNETALGIIPSQKLCFKVTPKPNTTIVQQSSPQVFKAVLIVKAQNGASPTELTL